MLTIRRVQSNLSIVLILISSPEISYYLLSCRFWLNGLALPVARPVGAVGVSQERLFKTC